MGEIFLRKKMRYEDNDKDDEYVLLYLILGSVWIDEI
jgi:hypothetical protein